MVGRRKSWGSRGDEHEAFDRTLRKGQSLYYMGRRTKGNRMTAHNARIRRELIYILWDVDEPLTKQEITTHLEKRMKLINAPSAISLGTILSRNPQVNSEKTVIITTGDGRRRRVPQYEINSELIYEIEDIIFTLPYNALTKKEQESAVLCKGCGRRRYFDNDMDLCLQCTRLPK